MKLWPTFRFSASLGIVISVWSSFTVKTNGFELNSAECGLSEPLGRVINGDMTWRPQVPWLVYIFTASQRGKGTPCGGSIITRDVIMTAAHCVKTGGRIARVVVYYNTTRLQDDNYIDVESAVVHPKYRNLDSGYNIALLKLSRPIDRYDRFVRPVCLPWQGKRIRAGQMLIAGYGAVNMQNKPSDHIFYYMANVLSERSCSLAMAHQWKHIKAKVWKLFMCTKNLYQTAYTGDSGDPVTAISGGRSVQYGIVTFGQKQNRGPAPVMHTKVSMFIDWINDSLDRIDRWKRLKHP
ncbi:chymotrypsin-1-like isoform X2 [Rhipicephalus microplus]|uniref:chymotrypsin-1-like isoform X2 n=1 Tax=Rhipicephalus microplus TaxID=6941 RepID=UPI003F6ABE80